MVGMSRISDVRPARSLRNESKSASGHFPVAKKGISITRVLFEDTNDAFQGREEKISLLSLLCSPFAGVTRHRHPPWATLRDIVTRASPQAQPFFSKGHARRSRLPQVSLQSLASNALRPDAIERIHDFMTLTQRATNFGLSFPPGKEQMLHRTNSTRMKIRL